MNRSRNSLFAGFTIIIGILLLFNTTGVLGWDIWQYVLDLWPLILISIGLDLVFRGTKFLDALAVIFQVMILFLAGIYIYLKYENRIDIILPTYFHREIHIKNN